MKLLIAIVVLGALFLLLRLLLPHLGASAASGIVNLDGGATALGDCPDTPNCQGSQSSRTEQRVKPLLASAGSVSSDVIASIEARLKTQPGIKIISFDSHYLHATSSSRVLGFVDDIEFLYSDGSVQIRSASRLGHSDLGANRKRIESLRELLKDL